MNTWRNAGEAGEELYLPQDPGQPIETSEGYLPEQWSTTVSSLPPDLLQSLHVSERLETSFGILNLDVSFLTLIETIPVRTFGCPESSPFSLPANSYIRWLNDSTTMSDNVESAQIIDLDEGSVGLYIETSVPSPLERRRRRYQSDEEKC